MCVDITISFGNARSETMCLISFIPYNIFIFFINNTNLPKFFAVKSVIGSCKYRIPPQLGITFCLVQYELYIATPVHYWKRRICNLLQVYTVVVYDTDIDIDIDKNDSMPVYDLEFYRKSEGATKKKIPGWILAEKLVLKTRSKATKFRSVEMESCSLVREFSLI